MRHNKSGVKLGRTSSHRKAMFRNMVTSLFKHEKIKTTDVKAKEVRRWADKIITLAKRGDLHARRQALSIIREKDIVHKLFDEANAKFGSRNGGYTRLVKIGRRNGDAAPITIIELISSGGVKEKKKQITDDDKIIEVPTATERKSETESGKKDMLDAKPELETQSEVIPNESISSDEQAKKSEASEEGKTE